VTALWEVTARSGSLVVAAERALPANVVRNVHAGELEERVRRFLAHAQQKRVFRRDVSTSWLMALFHATLHAAANELHEGRLEGDTVAKVITTSLLGAYQPPSDPHRPARRRSGRT
jgi:hypothetical protein